MTMRIEEIPIDMTYPQSKEERTPGIHVSNVLRLIAQENGVLKKERAEEFGLVDLQGTSGEEWWARLPLDVQLKICMGLAWEEWYIPQLEDVLDHPGELCIEGIYLTPDGESLDTVITFGGELLILCIHEVKLTYKSLNTIGNLSTQWLWLAQTKAYCKAKQTLVAYLHVLAVCGDYSRPIRPVLKVFRIIFTQAEIDENWDVIRGYVEYYQNLEHEDLLRDTYDAHTSTT
jgi:hypothetical protein